jgi:plasmid maintenance system antidote protein VapI
MVEKTMKVGDIVQHCFSEKIGVTIKEVFDPLCGVTSSNKVFDILWQDGTIGHNVWNYDLEVISESR